MFKSFVYDVWGKTWDFFDIRYIFFLPIVYYTILKNKINDAFLFLEICINDHFWLNRHVGGKIFYSCMRIVIINPLVDLSYKKRLIPFKPRLGDLNQQEGGE